VGPTRVLAERVLFVLLKLPFCVLRSLFSLACPAMFPACVPVPPSKSRSAQTSVLRSSFCVLTPTPSVLSTQGWGSARGGSSVK
jgi:hypothetical protein